jgi:hypothetical protein
MAKRPPRDEGRNVPVDHADVFSLLDSGLSQKEVARRVGCHPSNISRLNIRRLRAQTNGHASAPPAHSNPSPIPLNASVPRQASRRAAVPPNGHHPSASPTRFSASGRIIGIWESLEDRLRAVEAFVAAHQQSQRLNASPAHAEALQRAEPPERVSQGSHFAADMLPRVKAYMARHRLEKREVVDLALRMLFAGEEVRDDD